MTEFQELIKDAPKFDLMERGELVAYAYAMYAARAKADTENARLRELVFDLWDFFCVVPDEPHTYKEELDFIVEVWKRMRELGVEVDR